MNKALFILFQSLLCLVQSTQVLASESSSNLDNALQQEIVELVLQSGEYSDKQAYDDFYYLAWSYSDSLYMSATGSFDAQYFWNSDKVSISEFIKYLTDEITYEFYRGKILGVFFLKRDITNDLEIDLTRLIYEVKNSFEVDRLPTVVEEIKVFNINELANNGYCSIAVYLENKNFQLVKKNRKKNSKKSLRLLRFNQKKSPYSYHKLED